MSLADHDALKAGQQLVRPDASGKQITIELVAEDRAQLRRRLHGHVVGPERLQPLVARVQQEGLGPAVEFGVAEAVGEAAVRVVSCSRHTE